MIRVAVIALLLCGLALAGCTNTIRGLGKDLHWKTMQNYNARGDVELNTEVEPSVESRTSIEVR